MPPLRLQVDLWEWFIQGTFLMSIIFALVYIPFFGWRETKTGRAIITLILSLAGALLRPVLILWGVIIPVVKPASAGFWDNFLTWISVISLGVAGIAVTTLVFITLQILFAESENKWMCRLFFVRRKPARESGRKTT